MDDAIMHRNCNHAQAQWIAPTQLNNQRALSRNRPDGRNARPKTIRDRSAKDTRP